MSGDKIHRQFKANMAERGLHNVILFRQSCRDWYVRPVGFAYLDGDHTREGTLEQIAVAKKASAQEVCIHDYDTNGGGLEIARAIRDSGIDLIRLVGTMAHCRFKD